MFNSEKRARLHYEMERRGITTKSLCAALGISRSSLSRKLKGEHSFTAIEIQRAVDFLGLESAHGIFLD